MDIGELNEKSFPSFNRDLPAIFSSDQTGRRYLVQGGLPYNPKTEKVDINIAMDLEGPFLAVVNNYIIQEKDDGVIDLIPEQDEDMVSSELGIKSEPEPEIELITENIPLYERKERVRKQRLVARKAQKRGKKCQLP